MLLNLSSIPHYCIWPDATQMLVNKHFKQEMLTACPCIETAINPLTNESSSAPCLCAWQMCQSVHLKMLWRQLDFVFTKCKVATCHELLDTRDSNFYLQSVDVLHQCDTKGNTDAKQYIKVINPHCAKPESAMIQLQALGTCDWCHFLPFHLVDMLHHQVTRIIQVNWGFQTTFCKVGLSACSEWPNKKTPTQVTTINLCFVPWSCAQAMCQEYTLNASTSVSYSQYARLCNPPTLPWTAWHKKRNSLPTECWCAWPMCKRGNTYAITPIKLSNSHSAKLQSS